MNEGKLPPAVLERLLKHTAPVGPDVLGTKDPLRLDAADRIRRSTTCGIRPEALASTSTSAPRAATRTPSRPSSA